MTKGIQNTSQEVESMWLLSVYNIAPIYRKGIFQLMEKTFPCDWIFGTALSDIKQMSRDDFHGKVKFVNNKNILFGKAYWQSGVLRSIGENYSHYIFIGDERCISTWFSIIYLRLFPGKRVYLWSHGVYGRENIYKRVIQKLFYGIVDGVFLYGNYAREIMINRGFKGEKLFVIHNSLNYERQLELRRSTSLETIYENHFGNGNPVIIMIGRLNRRKHLDYLIDSLLILQQRGKHYNVVLIGDGEDKESLEMKVRNMGLSDRFWFYGACYDERENARLLSNADLCVVPGDIGLTAIHSLMFGVPAITHNCFKYQGPEFEAIIPGITGDFFEYGSVESLSNVIQRWFDKGINREEIRRACYCEIDSNWNPNFQINVLKKVLLT